MIIKKNKIKKNIPQALVQSTLKCGSPAAIVTNLFSISGEAEGTCPINWYVATNKSFKNGVLNKFLLKTKFEWIRF